MAARTYGEHPQAAEYDRVSTHEALIVRLCDEYPDGWAMSLHTPSLRAILPLCPADVRVMAWCKPWAPFRPGNKGAHYAWEPIIVRGGRPFTERLHAVRDYTLTPMVLGGAKAGFGKGTKPEGLIFWLADVLNLGDDDELVDIFPGSGAVGRAWELWKKRRRLPFAG
jgi:hypothetical protein